jgi:hypothetical protein
MRIRLSAEIASSPTQELPGEAIREGDDNRDALGGPALAPRLVTAFAQMSRRSSRAGARRPPERPRGIVMGRPGIEPGTLGLRGPCSAG